MDWPAKLCTKITRLDTIRHDWARLENPDFARKCFMQRHLRRIAAKMLKMRRKGPGGNAGIAIHTNSVEILMYAIEQGENRERRDEKFIISFSVPSVSSL
jgi:hypothetical protein